MDFAYFLGRDVSKTTLNFCFRDAEHTEPVQEGQIANTKTAIAKVLQRRSQELDTAVEDFAHCVENSGR